MQSSLQPVTAPCAVGAGRLGEAGVYPRTHPLALPDSTWPRVSARLVHAPVTAAQSAGWFSKATGVVASGEAHGDVDCSVQRHITTVTPRVSWCSRGTCHVHPNPSHPSHHGPLEKQVSGSRASSGLWTRISLALNPISTLPGPRRLRGTYRGSGQLSLFLQTYLLFLFVRK